MRDGVPQWMKVRNMICQIAPHFQGRMYVVCKKCVPWFVMDKRVWWGSVRALVSALVWGLGLGTMCCSELAVNR